MIEDGVLIIHLMAEWLSERGFAVHEVADTDAALRYIDGGGAVVMLFTDVNLPGGMNGKDLAVKVRERRPGLPVVYTSGCYSNTGLDHLVPRRTLWPSPMIQTIFVCCSGG